MKKIYFLYIRKKVLYISSAVIFYLMISLIIIVIILIKNTAMNVFSYSSPLYGKIILIDPGHGGIDGGANVGNVLEKNINLDAAIILKSKLESYGAKVILSRNKDISLENLYKDNDLRHKRDLKARVYMINNQNIDVFISLHVNAINNDPNVKGPMIFYSDINLRSRIVAECIQYTLNKITGINREPYIADFYLLKNAKKPGILLEMGFITNEHDKNLLLDKKYLSKLSEGITDGLIEYFSK